MDGLTVAQKEYDRELIARRNDESEIIRLRVLLSGQAAKLTALTGESSRREARRKMSEELNKNLDRLEKDLSKLKAEREVTLAEVEELCSSKRYLSHLCPHHTALLTSIQCILSHIIGRRCFCRPIKPFLDDAAGQHQETVSYHELVPLTRQRDTLFREIAELRSAREQFLEETAVAQRSERGTCQAQRAIYSTDGGCPC